MKYWAVTFTHTSFIAAETEEEAKEDCVDQVTDNAAPEECQADEIEEKEYNDHWDRIINGKKK